MLGFAKQLIEKGVRANAVAPGPFWTVLQPSGGQPDEKVKLRAPPVRVYLKSRWIVLE